MVPAVPAVRAALGKAVSARLVLRAKVPLAGLAVRALRVERPDKARRVASVLPVVRVQVARVLPPWMVLEVVSVLPAALELVDRVPLPLTLLVANVLPVLVDRVPLPLTLLVANVLPVQADRVQPLLMVLEVVSVLPAALALVDRVPAKAVSVRLVPEAKVRRGARRKSHPPRHRNPPPRISLDIR